MTPREKLKKDLEAIHCDVEEDFVENGEARDLYGAFIDEVLDAVVKALPGEQEDPAPFSTWTDPEHGWNAALDATKEAITKLRA